MITRRDSIQCRPADILVFDERIQAAYTFSTEGGTLQMAGLDPFGLRVLWVGHQAAEHDRGWREAVFRLIEIQRDPELKAHNAKVMGLPWMLVDTTDKPPEAA